jgi:hypothetical protein
MRGVKLLVLFACAVTLAGCGLPDQYYLQPPVPQSPAPGAYFAFLNPNHLTGDSNVTFKGYELYYRFYPDSVSINTNAYDPNNTADVVSQLTSNGFLPVASDQDSYPARTFIPVVPIDPADIATSFSVHVNINTVGVIDSFFSFSPVIASLTGNVRRNVQDLVYFPGHFKTYFGNQTSIGNYQAIDADCGLITGQVVGVPTGTVYLAMYALSFGLQGTPPTTPLRSIPVYLGYLQLQIN